MNDNQTLPAGPFVVMPRRGLSRENAALYIGISPSKFDELVKAGTMPRPKRIGKRTIWDIKQLDAAFDSLPTDGETSNDVWYDVAA